jgi:peroxiredoxin
VQFINELEVEIMIDANQVASAPDFSAIDSEGKSIHLSDYKGKKNVLLVFNRGFWCPHCRRHMAELRQDYQKYVESNTEVITVGPEDAKAFTSWWHDHQMPFIGIPDPQHDIAKLYSQQFKLFKGGRMPALALIDKEGKIRLMHYGDSPGDIPSDAEILALLDNLNKEAVSTPVKAAPVITN